MKRAISRRKAGKIPGGFLAIIAFKIVKGFAFLVFGIAARKLSHAAAMPSAIEIANFLSVSRENALVRWVAHAIAGITPGQATAIGAASLFIAAVFFAEAAFLAARLWWSTYVTIMLTALGIPLELYEIVEKPGAVRRYVLLAVNVAILAFLWARRNEFRDRRAPAGS